MCAQSVQAAVTPLSATTAVNSGLLPRAVIARSFGAAAQQYDQHAVLQRTVADQLLARVPENKKNGVVLDLGCGTGYCSRHLRARFPDSLLLALDVALPMLQQTRMQSVDAQLVAADAANLPMQNSSVDLVVSSLTLQWCEAYAQVFAELQRVLVPGGTALLSSFGPATLQELRSAWAMVDHYQHVNTFVPAAELQQAAELAGLHCSLERSMLTEHYPSLHALSRALKGLGAHNMNRQQAAGLTTPGHYRQAAQNFAASRQGEAGIPVSWEIYYLLLHKVE